MRAPTHTHTHICAHVSAAYALWEANSVPNTNTKKLVLPGLIIIFKCKNLIKYLCGQKDEFLNITAAGKCSF